MLDYHVAADLYQIKLYPNPFLRKILTDYQIACDVSY